MNKVFKEFKEFAIKGNMFDMAIGIIIGTAFGKVISSLVADVITPVISLFTGPVNFENLAFVIKPQVTDSSGEVIQQMVAVRYGNFIQVAIDFLIISITIFIIIRLFNGLKRKAENVEDKTVSTPKDIELLTEIRDLLKK